MWSKINFTAHQITFDNDKSFKKSIKNVTGFRPGKIIFYKLACIHRSASFYYKKQLINNERLEFLGDAILGAVVAEYLYNRFPEKDEGFLTKFRSKLVNGQTLTELAERTGLDQLLFTRSLDKEQTNHVLGDFFEAFIGAVYLDKGYKKTREFIINRILEALVDMDDMKRRDTNYKSLLIEWAQKHKNPVRFETACVNNENAHNPEFETRVLLDEQDLGIGKGRSKKEAEQNAAREALVHLEK
ncbi:MAG TPA: ribonuclease III [Salinivirga sp.]|uniref:ribonuclease III n=1 Tax=Salinivirga sp. TaxID=1970192 RepID=UPI002B47A32F|nr:ribonuclease III [Salinivirga sp.]HKK58280.1 ribonuclease III [Salinivirga sp.]